MIHVGYPDKAAKEAARRREEVMGYHDQIDRMRSQTPGYYPRNRMRSHVAKSVTCCKDERDRRRSDDFVSFDHRQNRASIKATTRATSKTRVSVVCLIRGEG